MRIYCLINAGNSLTDEMAQYLFDKAQEVIGTKSRKCRLRFLSAGLSGELVTEYKVGFMGTISGIVFKANIDWKGGSSKTEFVVKPIENRDEISGAKWTREPLFPVANPDPALN